MNGTENKTKKRDRIGVILYVVYILMLVASVVVIVRMAAIQIFWKPEEKINRALTPQVLSRTVEPARGNIYDCNGHLLAMSCPTYQIGIDCTVMKKEYATMRDREKGERLEAEWRAKARKLSEGLAKEFPGKSASEFYNAIISGRESGKKYLKIGKPVDRNTYNRLCTLPLFNEGRYKGGMSVERESVRVYPYGTLARRTIGFVRSNRSDIANTHIGIEGRYDHVLHGRTGKEWLRKTDAGYVRNNDSTAVSPKDGTDIVTTLNIDYQEMADKALREQLEGETELIGACLVLMEVKTGAIRAMVNLGFNPETGALEESQNFAVGRKAEPGSVFKTATLMSVLNDGYVKSLDERIPIGNGHVAGTSIDDQHARDFGREHNTQTISVLEGLEISSNYVYARLAIDHYGKNQSQYLGNLHSWNLGDRFDFDIDGMPTPTLPGKTEKSLKYDDLGRLGFGYISEETPMHILTFYNAIAGKGKMMKPYLVETGGGPSVLNSAVCTPAVADTLTRALRAVVENGTAKWSFRGVKCPVAGKTGTSFGTFPGGGYSDSEGRKKYTGTFVCFFPADNPQYTAISCVYSNPTRKQYQGGGIPARALKTVINKLYNTDPCFRQTLEK